MKIKNIFLFSLIAILFFSCDPNKKVYEELDAAQKPYNEQLSYTLKDADYTTIKKLALKTAKDHSDSSTAGDIAKFKSFSKTRDAVNYIIPFLESSFIALDSASAMAVTYNYSNKITLSSKSVGGVFTSYAAVAAAINVPNPKEGDLLFMLFNYDDGSGPVTKKALFKYDTATAWIYPDDAYFVEDSDYETIGTATGEPGDLHAFSDAYPAENYLPTFFSLKYPYAQQGKTFEVTYRYGSDNIYDIYTFDGDKWNNATVKTTNFVQNGTAWFFDPTVRFYMSGNDYQRVVDWVINTDSIKDYAPYANSEYYYGASTYHNYNEFDMQLSNRKKYDSNGYLTGLTDDEISAVIWGRIQYAVQYVLEQDFPNSVATVNGIPVYYEVSFKTYEPPAHTYMLKFLCTGAGQFKYVEGPTLVK